LDEAQRLYKEHRIKDKMELPGAINFEYGIEIHEGLTQGEFVNSSLIFKISPFNLEEVDRGEEIVFSSKVNNTEVIVEVDRMSRKRRT
jgi:hypothetical protein